MLTLLACQPIMRILSDYYWIDRRNEMHMLAIAERLSGERASTGISINFLACTKVWENYDNIHSVNYNPEIDGPIYQQKRVEAL
jgi:hypothetical protein